MSNAAKDIAEHRRERLQRWIDSHFAGKQSHFLEGIAARTGEIANQGELSGLLSGKKSFGEKKARKLEMQAAMPNLYLDSVEEGGAIHNPVSLSDATTREDVSSGVRKIRVEGAVEMDEQGYWRQGDRNAEETRFPTEDPAAYAIRIMVQTFQPALAAGQCILVSPGEEPRPGRPVLVILMDGRRTLRNFHSFDRGVWTFTKVNDGNAFSTLNEDKVAAVERVMAYLWTE